MFAKILKSLLSLTLALTLICVVIVSVSLYHEPAADELRTELREIKSELDKNADVDMQSIYPEGFVFMNALYATAWSSLPDDEAHKEIEKAWTKIRDDRSLPDGSFYNGWSSYVLASKLRIEKVRDAGEIKHLEQQCDQIAYALQQQTYPPSYPGAAWPADVVVCVASLSFHDEILEPKYNGVIVKWLNEVKNQLDDRGMIPHGTIGGARGSSMALMLIFLKTIDQNFALDQFIRFKENFVSNKFGLTGILEYPKGESGQSDIDSGPVVLGFGGAATIVGMRTLSEFGEEELALKIRKEVDAINIISFPIADAFIAWSHSGMTDGKAKTSFTEFHLYSVFAFTILAIAFWFTVPKDRASSQSE